MVASFSSFPTTLASESHASAPPTAQTPGAGSVWAWGYNGQGELGNGTTANSDVPAPVNMPSGVNFSAVAGGSNHSLGVASNGSAWAWGYNGDGELGNGTGADSTVPVAVSMPGGVSFTAVAGGGLHSLALASNGNVWAWGYNGDGELGNGTTTNSDVPVAVSMPSGVRFTAVAAGNGHSIALASNGTVWAWGFNGQGELGNGTTTNSDVPVAIVTPKGVTFTAIAGGDSYSLALASNGAAWAWGDNLYGQLGNGTTTNSDVPVAVSMPTGITFRAAAAGSAHSLAVAMNGTLWAWGYNFYGQLGNGSTANSDSPVPANMPNSVLFSSVAGGQDHSLALATNGTAWAWGQGAFGQLGNGTTANSGAPVPVRMPNGVRFAAIAAPFSHSLAVESSAAPLGGPPIASEEFGGANACWPCSHPYGLNTQYPVNTSTGDFFHSFTDFSIPGRGISVLLARTYNSLAAGTNSPFGYGWTDSYNTSLTVNPSTGAATINQEDGAQVRFTLASGTYTPPPRDDATLVHNGDGTFTFVRRNTQTFTFSAAGQLLSEQDLNGYTTTLGYNGTSQLATVTDAGGRQLKFIWTGTHISGVSDPLGHSFTYTYSSTGNLAKVTDVGGFMTTFTYDSSHLLLTMADPRGGIVTNTYDSTGRVLAQTDPMGRKTTFVYNGDLQSAAGGTTTINDPKGNVTVETYQYGLRTSVTYGYGTQSAATWSFVYDPAALGVTSTTDPNGHVVSQTLDAFGNVLSSTTPGGRVTRRTYNAFNEPLTTTDPNGVKSTMTYDPRGNLTSVSTPLSGTTQVQLTSNLYDDNGHPGDITSMTDPDGNTAKYTYDTYGNRNSVTDPLGDTTTTTYNLDGWPLSVIDPRGKVTKNTYDNRGNLVTVTDSLAHVTTYGYDGDRNRTAVTDPLGQKSTTVYDFGNEPTQVTLPNGQIQQTQYDADGNVGAQTDGLSQSTFYTYDPLNHLASVTDPLSRTTTYTYDGFGNLLTVKLPDGQTTTNGYDANNELIAIAYSDGTTPGVTMGYDSDGQRITMSDGAGSSSWTWDSLHRMTRSSDGTGAVVGYGYDLMDQLTKLTYPNGKAVIRKYDAAGRLGSVTDWLSKTIRFSYDRDSNMTTETFPSASTVVDTFTYNNADQLTSISDQRSGHQFASFLYTRNSDGLVLSEKSTGVPVPNQLTYNYDKANRLTQVNTNAYSYDAGNNVTHLINGSTLLYDKANELQSTATGTGKTTFGYDRQGNRAIATPSTGTASTYAWDQENRLTAFTKGSTAANYVYNGDGLRMSKTSGSSAQSFVWDEAGPLPLLVSDGSTSYVYGPGGLPVEQISSGNAFFYHHDQLGSSRVLSDSTGAARDTWTYDPYGNVVSSTGTVANHLLFSGQYSDNESGLYDLRARYYDPTNAQFLSRDPEVKVTRLPYVYVQGDPLNGTDPSGLTPLGPNGEPCNGGVAGCWVNGECPVCEGHPLCTEVCNGAVGVVGAGLCALAGGGLGCAIGEGVWFVISHGPTGPTETRSLKVTDAWLGRFQFTC